MASVDDSDGAAGDPGAEASRGNGAAGAAATPSTDPELGPYIYRDARGNPHGKVVRTPNSSSRFAQKHWDGTAWRPGMPKRKLPYRLPELLDADPANWVCIPEGEKDAVNLAKLGFVATTNPNGAKGWKNSKLIPYIADRTRIAIFEDNDDAGRDRTKKIIKTLRVLDPMPDIRVVPFPELPGGGDVSDWLAQDRRRGYAEVLARIEAVPAGGKVELESMRASDGELRATEWLWRYRFAIGKIGVIAGLPDEGKGQMLCYIIARVTRGLEWPIDEGHCAAGNIVILSAEEDPNTSLFPRLEAAGADRTRVHVIKMVHDSDENGQPCKRMFSLISDLERLRQKILEVGDVRAVLIDPITAYFGINKMDSYRDTDVRAVLGPLKELAEEVRAAVIAVMHFNKKMDVTNALLRVSNSLAFVGLPRHVYAVIDDDENDRKLLVRAKNNDAAKSVNQTLAFHFEVKQVGFDIKLNEPICAPCIVWEPNYVDVTATEAMQAASENKSPGGRDNAKKFVLNLLAGGQEIPATEVKSAGEANGLSWRTINRAKEELKEKDGFDIIIDKDRSKPDGKWFWKLPQHAGE
jgi:putative DNA primase/helicase